MKDDLHNPDFFSDSKRPSLEEMYRYLDDTLSPEEKHALEADMIDDPLFSEAMEGLAEVKDREKVGVLLAGAEADFMKKLKQKEKEEKKVIALPPMGWLVAAAVALVLVLFSFLYFNNPGLNSEEVNLADGTPVESNEKTTVEKKDREAELETTEFSSSPERDLLLAEERNETPIPKPAPSTEPVSPSITLADGESWDSDEFGDFEEMPIEEPADDFDMEVAMEEEAEEAEVVDYSFSYSGNDNAGGRALSSPTMQEKTEVKMKDKKQAMTRKNSNVISSKEIASTTKSASRSATGSGNAGVVATQDEGESEIMSKSTSPSTDTTTLNAVSPRVGQVNNQAWYIQNESITQNNISRDSDPFLTARALEQEGFNLYNSHDFKGAAKSYEKALKLDPDNAKARYYLGLSYLELDKPDKAISQFDRILLDGNNPYFEDAQWYRTQAYIAQNEQKEAKKELEKIKSKGGKYRSKAIESLKDF